MAYNGQGQGHEYGGAGGHPMQDMPAGSTVRFDANVRLRRMANALSITSLHRSTRRTLVATFSTNLRAMATTRAAWVPRHLLIALSRLTA